MKYQADVSYYIQEYTAVNIDAADRDDLEQKVIDYIKEITTDGIVKDIALESYMEIK